MKNKQLLSSSPVIVWLVYLSFTSLLSSCGKSDDPAPEANMRVSKIVWAESDYQQFSYHANGRLSQYVSQWTYINDGSGETRKLVADYAYNAANQLTKVTFNSGYYNVYYYEGTRLRKLEEYDNKNRLALTHIFSFNTTGQLREMLTQVHDKLEGNGNLIKRMYTYDSQGNVTEEKVFNKNTPQTDFTLSTRTVYTDYDSKKSPDNLMALFPYVPQVQMNVNNPGTISVLAGEQQIPVSVAKYTYQYTDKGYPASKTVRIESSSVPPVSATYYYE